MSTRISTSQYIQGFIGQVYDTRNKLEQVRGEISSGIKVSNPSDDPGRSGTIVNLQAVSQRVDKHLQRVGAAKDLLQIQEQTVNSSNDVLIRAQELAAQAANGTYTPEVRAQMSEEIFQLREQLVSLANTKHNGVYIYGGTDDGDQPFDANSTFYPTPATGNPLARLHYQLDSAVTSPGQDDTRNVRISDTESIRINTPARDVFYDAINAVERLGRAMAGFRTDLIDADSDGVIDDPNPAGTHLAYTFPGDTNLQVQAIRDAINSINAAKRSNIETELSSIGARTNRLDQTESILATLKENTEVARSSIQDTDIFEASSKFSNLQTTLEALLASGSRISSLSLLDYI